MRKLSEVIENHEPLILPPQATVRQACQGMRERRLGAVLVVDENHKLLGIFTGRDAVYRVLAEGKAAVSTRLSSVMTQTPSSLSSGCGAIEALRLMRDGGFRHVPVVDDGRVKGVVARADFVGIEIDRLDEETGLWEKL